MSCERIGNAFICRSKVYFYKGFLFEYHYFCGPVKLNKDFEPAKRQGLKFFRVASEWAKLNNKEKYEV